MHLLIVFGIVRVNCKSRKKLFPIFIVANKKEKKNTIKVVIHRLTEVNNSNYKHEITAKKNVSPLLNINKNVIIYFYNL